MIWGSLGQQSRYLVAGGDWPGGSGSARACLVAPRREGWTSQTICNLSSWEPSGFTVDIVAALSGEINSLPGTWVMILLLL